MVSNKTGLSYFGIDTDIFQDRKIKRLKKTFGCAGIAIYIYLLCDVYRDKGCVLVWDEDCAFDVAEYLGVKESLVNEVVKYCGAVGLFNEELLSCGIVTSESIQRRYIEMCKRARRTSANIPEEWRLITEESGKITEECGEITEDCGVTPTFSDKEKKSKVKESKEKESSVCEEAHTPTPAQEINPDLELFKKFVAWCEVYAPTVLWFKEPLTLDQFIWIRQRFSAEKIKQCATELHNKEAYAKGRSAIYTWKTWLNKMR
jgi:hypothetical protein